MRLSDNNTHVFILRIWREPEEVEDAQCEWRGTVQNIRDGEQRFFCDLNEIAAFLAGYLREMGVNPHQRWWKALWRKWSKPRARA